ncbi:MAG: hypothetical protein JSS86_23025, partial [Cyanobacteria bacterium SZAS LIN-2]|nr:hypothetical protein [Cyanobacteria bacterium SZAS LIN-2]
QGLRFAPEGPPSTVLSIAPGREIVCGDIAGMQVASSDIKLSSPADPKLVRRPIDFEFSCEVAAPKSGGSAFVGLEFQGKDSQGAVKRWTSLWQPAEIKTGKDWTRVYFSDCIPADFAGLQDLKATVTVCPFHPDLLVLHQKQAIKRKVLVRNLLLKLTPLKPLLSATDEHSMRLY